MATPSLTALLSAVEAHLASGDADTALGLAEQAASEFPAHVDAQLALAQAAAAAHDGLVALAAADAALELDGGNPALMLVRAGFLLDFLDEAPEAADVLERVVAFLETQPPPEDPEARQHMDVLEADARTRLAEAYLLLDEPEAALETLRALTSVAAASPTAGCLRARALMETGNPEDALEEIVASLQRHPAHAEAHVLHGRLLLARGEDAAGAAALARAHRLAPEAYPAPVALDVASLKAVLPAACALLSDEMRAWMKAVELRVDLLPDPADEAMPLAHAPIHAVGEGPPERLHDPAEVLPEALVLHARNIQVMLRDLDDLASVVATLITLELTRFCRLNEDPPQLSDEPITVDR